MENTDIVVQADAINMEPRALDESSRRAIRSPRSAWFEILLFLVTLSIYGCFWLFGRARDIKTATGNEFRPWLWFLAYLTTIPLLFAYPRMFRQLEQLEGDNTPPAWKKWQWLWMLGLVASVVLILLESILEASALYYVCSTLISGVLLYTLHQRFNHWKSGLAEQQFHSKASGYHWYEWLSLAVCLPLWLMVLYYFVLAPMLVDSIKTIEKDQVIVNAELGYSMVIYDEGWEQVAVGSYSDGDAEVEFEGPLMEHYFLVFDYGVTTSLESVADNRAELRYDFDNTPNCIERRALSEDQTSVISFTECAGRFLTDSVRTFSTLIESNDKVVELYGLLSAKRIDFKEHADSMRKTAMSFKPL